MKINLSLRNQKLEKQEEAELEDEEELEEDWKLKDLLVKVIGARAGGVFFSAIICLSVTHCLIVLHTVGTQISNGEPYLRIADWCQSYTLHLQLELITGGFDYKIDQMKCGGVPEGGGVINCQNLADDFYGCPLWIFLFFRFLFGVVQ